MVVSLVFVGLIIVTYIGIEISQKPEHAIFFKGIASFSFIIVWSLASLKIGILIEYQILILLGLVLGLLGDLMLALRPLRPSVENETLILRGMSLFSFGHFFYFLAILTTSNLHFLSLVVGVIGTGIFVLISKRCHYQMGKIATYNYLYTFLLFFMVGQSLGSALQMGWSPFTLILFIGFVLFALSDFILASIYFQNKNTKLLTTLNLASYYVAQILIAFSIFYL